MEKTEKILSMIEHPERYSDEEFKAMLSDPESRKIYNTIAEANAAMDMDDADINVDEEWAKFAAAHPEAAPQRRFTFGSKRGVMKAAAVFAGVVMLSGVSFAAYHYAKSARKTAQDNAVSVTANVQKTQAETAPDTISIKAKKPAVQRTFINITLEKMLTEMAAYYDVKVVFKSGSAKRLRLYYDWDSRKSMAEVVKDLNRFENVTLTLNKGTLTAE